MRQNQKIELVKLATIKREFLNLYNGDPTLVIVHESEGQSTVKNLYHKDKPEFTLPTEHLNVFDQIPKNEFDQN